MRRDEVARELAKYYSDKFGLVQCYFSVSKRAYCIYGSGLPEHPDMFTQYPQGWTPNYIKPSEARALVASAKSNPNKSTKKDK